MKLEHFSLLTLVIVQFFCLFVLTGTSIYLGYNPFSFDMLGYQFLGFALLIPISYFIVYFNNYKLGVPILILITIINSLILNYSEFSVIYHNYFIVLLLSIVFSGLSFGGIFFIWFDIKWPILKSLQFSLVLSFCYAISLLLFDLLTKNPYLKTSFLTYFTFGLSIFLATNFALIIAEFVFQYIGKRFDVEIFKTDD